MASWQLGEGSLADHGIEDGARMSVEVAQEANSAWLQIARKLERWITESGHRINHTPNPLTRSDAGASAERCEALYDVLEESKEEGTFTTAGGDQLQGYLRHESR